METRRRDARPWRAGLLTTADDPHPLDDRDKAGLTDLHIQTPHVRDGMGFHQERDTVLHEAMHAAVRLGKEKRDPSKHKD